MRSSLLFAIRVAISSATVVSCQGSDADGSKKAPLQAGAPLSASAEAGRRSFETHCIDCHGADARSGRANRPIPSLARDNAELVKESILNGSRRMPPFGEKLSKQQLNDLVAYLASLP